jgi:hypothetical protein
MREPNTLEISKTGNSASRAFFHKPSARQDLSNRMEFPPVWTILPSEQFETTAAPNTAAHTMQLLAQLRSSGRILDSFQVKLGGTCILNAEVDMAALIPTATFKS